MSLGFFFGTSCVKLHSHDTRCLTLATTDDQLFFLCADSFCAWDLESETYEKLVEKLPCRIDFMALVPGSSNILFVGQRGLFLFDANRGDVRFQGELILPPEDTISCFAVSPDGSLAIVGSHQQTGVHSYSDLHLRLWNLSLREPVSDLEGHEHPVTEALFTPDGSRVITCTRSTGDHGFFAYESPRYRVWSVSEGICVDSFGGEKGSSLDQPYSEPWDQLSSSCMGISPNGKLGIFEAETRIALVDLATWRIVQRFDTGAEVIRAASFSLDGEHVFALGNNQAVYAWCRATGELERVVGGYSHEAREFVVTADKGLCITTHQNTGYEGWIYRRRLFPTDDV